MFVCVVFCSHEKLLAELREQLRAETNRAQHLEKCLRDMQQQLSDANEHVTALVCCLLGAILPFTKLLWLLLLI